MKLCIFSVFDVRSVQYGTPMFMVSRGTCIRSFGDEINKNDSSNMLCMHPEDFVLYELGEFDVETGEFVTHAPTQVVLGKDLKVAK